MMLDNDQIKERVTLLATGLLKANEGPRERTQEEVEAMVALTELIVSTLQATHDIAHYLMQISLNTQGGPR